VTEGELVVSRAGRLGSIRLNRPSRLNSLTLGMVRSFSQALEKFAADDGISAVLVTGAGERGLCAGGDIHELYELRGVEPNPFKQFWREEYQLNARIARFPKPYVVVMDGVVMGGGVGVSAHGNRRLVTERTRLAMPETGIGFIPDVGGTWLLTRDGGAGVYMALAGASVGAADAVRIGLADLRIDLRDIPRLEPNLAAVESVEEVDAVLSGFACAPGESAFEQHKALLDAAMMLDRIDDIMAALAADGSEFARQALRDIAGKSPTSLRLTHELLKLAFEAESLETCLTNEFRAACRLLETHDLYEGIRAAIIDKDRAPRWSPATLEEVDDATIAAILCGTGEADPAFPP
jgi:enoyl-CoA hydratase